ncbi:MAG: ATP-binding protein [Dehalococcoidia bacterium]
MVSTIQETIGREVVLALSNLYPSMADALMELVDNPFDYRHGRLLNIKVKVDKKKGRIVVTDYGGEGMGEDALRDWIQWGTGHTHSLDDIGQYHVGGKLAAMYLADSVEIIGRKAGQKTAFKFFDPHWGTRTEMLVSALEPLDEVALRWFDPDLARLPIEVGFSQFVLTNLKPHRYESSILLQRISNVYKHLVEQKKCHIIVNRNAVEPLEIPESVTYRNRAITIKKTKVASGVSVQGRIWVMDRDKIPIGRGVLIKAGIRTLFRDYLLHAGQPMVD